MLSSLEPYRDQLTIISDTDVEGAEARKPKEIGGDHFRSSATFLTQSHPKQTESSDVWVGTSLDQLYAQRFGQDTPIPSMQLCIENVDQAGGCAYGYACVYTDTISWAAPDQPLPMVRDPRVAFDQLFGAGGTPEARAARRRASGSVLDFIVGEVSALKRELDPVDGRRVDRYLNDIREIERRIQRVVARNESGEQRELPGAPAGVPDSFDEHVKLMFDLQALAFQADVTGVFSFKMGRDASSRVYPESGASIRRRIMGGGRRTCSNSPRSTGITSGSSPTSWTASRAFRRATPASSTRRWSSTARRWAIPTSTTTSAAPCSWSAGPTAGWMATCTCGRPRERRWRTSCSA